MFLEEFFDQNPISQLGIITMKNKRAEKLSELSGSCRKHTKALQG
jgi:transcription initiation factor TFIIH subunit 2